MYFTTPLVAEGALFPPAGLLSCFQTAVTVSVWSFGRTRGWRREYQNPECPVYIMLVQIHYRSQIHLKLHRTYWFYTIFIRCPKGLFKNWKLKRWIDHTHTNLIHLYIYSLGSQSTILMVNIEIKTGVTFLLKLRFISCSSPCSWLQSCRKSAACCRWATRKRSLQTLMRSCTQQRETWESTMTITVSIKC